MTRIVQDVEKTEVCKNCSRTVGYYMKDTFAVYTKDWQGHTVSKQCVHCPACGNKVPVCY